MKLTKEEVEQINEEGSYACHGDLIEEPFDERGISISYETLEVDPEDLRVIVQDFQTLIDTVNKILAREVCECCGKPQTECDAETAAIFDHNHEE
jgi:hypothetical protein